MNQRVLCCGNFDGSIKIFSLDNIQLIADFSIQGSKLLSFKESVVVLRESLGGTASVRERNIYHVGGSTNTGGHPVEYLPMSEEPGSKIDGLANFHLPENSQRGGITRMALSPDGNYMSVITEEKSSVVFVFNISRMALSHVLIHRQPVCGLDWDPMGLADRNRLAIATGDVRVFVWDPTGAAVKSVFEMTDESFKPTNVHWSASGDILILEDHDRMCTLSFDNSTTVSGG